MTVIQKRLPIFIASAIACSAVLAENPIKPIPDEELLKEVEALKPLKAAVVTPGATIDATAPRTLSTASTQVQLNGAPSPTATPSANGTSGIGPRQPMDRSSILAPGATGPETKPTGPDGTQQQPTEITAMEATFNQKANIAVFLINVFVKDPQFNMTCDKLTAYLKDEDATPAGTKPAPGAKGATPKPTGATPKPAGTTPAGSPKPGATPAAGTTATGTPAPVKKKSGLDKAIGVTTSDRRVIITQDKVETDGSITHSIGISNRAEYFADTGDVFLYGMPDVTQGTNRCIATSPDTWMKLMRDGRMEAHGPHKTIIVDTDRQSNQSASTQPGAATPAPSPSSR
ncbi:hypothetical protein EV701_108249 [Chthoniobacter flavus]|nr:hypothetical protein [Chthoniobacter flavus]TCO91521.1 hypothetical protein EV701_108249 [Chthoniobacter flavus]